VILLFSPVLAQAQNKPTEVKTTVPNISEAKQVSYWSARAVMMDSRLQLANLQLLGGSGKDWQTVNTDLKNRESKFNEIVKSIENICTIDIKSLNLGVLKCQDTTP
jgi:hypothetical protein